MGGDSSLHSLCVGVGWLLGVARWMLGRSWVLLGWYWVTLGCRLVNTGWIMVLDICWVLLVDVR